MKKFQNYINNNVLFKVADLNTATIITRIIAGILTSKAIAIFIGAEGLALIGNLRNFLSAIQSLSILGMYKGLVKMIGRIKSDVSELSKAISTTYYLGFFTTIILAFLSYYNAEYINDFLFSDNYNYTYIIEILAIVLPFYSLNMFVFAIMNGFSKFRMLLVINIIGQVFGLLITLLLIWQNKIDGALIAAVIAPSLAFLITLVGIANQRNLMGIIKLKAIDGSVIKTLSPYMLMTVVTAVALPMIYILIRNYIIDNVGIKEAGYWEAMNRISDYYLMFVNSLLALYILPRFSEIKGKKAFRDEVFGFYKSVIPFFIGGLILIYFLRSFIINIVFTDEFAPTESLFVWQLAGDLIKVLSVVIVYKFLAKKMYWHFIILEVFLFVILYVSSVYLIDIYGIEGAVIGHFITYIMYFGIVLLIFGSSLFGVIQEEN
ncbi:O-antigen translocase [Ichthyenterobacterium sp. W332]|uniref:O-antigen translocase n=1 Tax=Microcosmobacter mediterraneus TaxID=3075607 RepID=A0ABU2YNI6_9FLAO|nr:O-antigen translocase [Ichthyenterobacterium sp. W332]MDT0559244.1 O-antigen translocase [Ichthyenterobacterium sp. W332]